MNSPVRGRVRPVVFWYHPVTQFTLFVGDSATMADPTHKAIIDLAHTLMADTVPTVTGGAVRLPDGDAVMVRVRVDVVEREGTRRNLPVVLGSVIQPHAVVDAEFHALALATLGLNIGHALGEPGAHPERSALLLTKAAQENNEKILENVRTWVSAVTRLSSLVKVPRKGLLRWRTSSVVTIGMIAGMPQDDPMFALCRLLADTLCKTGKEQRGDFLPTPLMPLTMIHQGNLAGYEEPRCDHRLVTSGIVRVWTAVPAARIE